MGVGRHHAGPARGAGGGQAITVGCDLVSIEPAPKEALCRRLRERLLDFDAANPFLNATHTHTAPATLDAPAQRS